MISATMQAEYKAVNELFHREFPPIRGTPVAPHHEVVLASSLETDELGQENLRSAPGKVTA